MNAPRPWYFKDGTPINAEQIRKIVGRAHDLLRAVDASGSNGHDYLPSKPVASNPEIRRYLADVAQYFAKQIERDLVSLLIAEFESLRRNSKPVVASGDLRLDAQRAWRRRYQRHYRLRQISKMESAAHETK